ncbi:6190_t:CDS:2 [Racocetra fulgida]|uniref:6190_t:CDS:1 n=1 Tax=Racocetra fulgida TaxID=60492 RepID=A0A9N8YXC6_9GLOM|nr:6190_t:CDS:2 [Racocetra fulgida]
MYQHYIAQNELKKNYINKDTLEEVIDLNNFEDFIIQIVNLYKLQSESNLENILPFYFEYNIDISIFNKFAKEVVTELIECIENVDEFK